MNEEVVIAEIRSVFGEPARRAQALVDEFGAPYVSRGITMTQDAMAQGNVTSPFGMLIHKLRSGQVQAIMAQEAADEQAKDAEAEWLRDRYERAQADPDVDTAAKRLAARKLSPELEALAALWDDGVTG